MGWPDVRGLNEANRSREQQLWIRELFREEISPSCPSISSGEELVYRIFVHCFGEAQLGDMFFPIICHRKRWAIRLCLRKILQENIIFVFATK